MKLKYKLILAILLLITGCCMFGIIQHDMFNKYVHLNLKEEVYALTACLSITTFYAILSLVKHKTID